MSKIIDQSVDRARQSARVDVQQFIRDIISLQARAEAQFRVAQNPSARNSEVDGEAASWVRELPYNGLAAGEVDGRTAT